MLFDGFAVMQPAFFECPSFYPFSLQQDGLTAPEVDVSKCEIAQALVIALKIVMGDKGLDLGFKIAWQEVVLQQEAVLQGLVPAPDLALCLRMIRCSTNMIHAVAIEPFGNIRPT